MTLSLEIADWVSPRLEIRFVLTTETLEIYYPDGRRFLTTVELSQRAQRLAKRLRELGVDADLI